VRGSTIRWSGQMSLWMTRRGPSWAGSATPPVRYGSARASRPAGRRGRTTSPTARGRFVAHPSDLAPTPRAAPGHDQGRPGAVR
jgi:hypothetical protein